MRFWLLKFIKYRVNRLFERLNDIDNIIKGHCKCNSIGAKKAQIIELFDQLIPITPKTRPKVQKLTQETRQNFKSRHNWFRFEISDIILN